MSGCGARTAAGSLESRPHNADVDVRFVFGQACSDKRNSKAQSLIDAAISTEWASISRRMSPRRRRCARRSEMCWTSRTIVRAPRSWPKSSPATKLRRLNLHQNPDETLHIRRLENGLERPCGRSRPAPRHLASLVAADAFAGELTRGSFETIPASEETTNTQRLDSNHD